MKKTLFYQIGLSFFHINLMEMKKLMQIILKPIMHTIINRAKWAKNNLQKMNWFHLSSTFILC